MRHGPNDELPLNDEYTVKFLWQDSCAIDSEELAITEEEQLLNIFKRKSMRNAKFNPVKDAWFWKDANNPPHSRMGPQTVGDKCTVLCGYECAMHIIPTTNGHKKGILLIPCYIFNVFLW